MAAGLRGCQSDRKAFWEKIPKIPNRSKKTVEIVQLLGKKMSPRFVQVILDLTKRTKVLFLLSEAQPKNAIVNPPPPNWEMIVSHARTHASTRARAHACNRCQNVTIFKLRSTSEQMPALVN
jgi:hypothetical protein